METEIKLLLPPASRAAVEAHPLFAAAPPRRVHNLSTYYDTPDFALRARGVALRLRRADGHVVQTVKSLDGGSGFASRGEWEWPVASDALDPDALERDPEARALIGDDLGRVAPVFTTDVSRDIRVLTLDGKTTVEAAIDAGEVRAGGRSQPLSEVELELKGGPAGPLLRFAAELARDASLRFGPDSKSERGYALLTGDLPPHPGAAGLALPAGIALRDAFPALLAAAARDFAADLSPAARGDVEGVHRLRAAIRKMRTLFVLFAPHLDAEATARFERELRDLGRVLGGGRDWDVFITETLARRRGRPRRRALRGAARRRRGAASPGPRGRGGRRRRAGADGAAARPGAVDGRRRMDEARDGRRRALPRPPAGPARPAGTQGAEARPAPEGARCRGPARPAQEPEEAALRLRGRRRRCSGTRDVHRYVATIKKVLQDLGRINDAAVTEARVADLAPADHAGLAGPAAALLAWNDRRRRGHERDLRRRWRKFRHADPFWS